MQRENATSIGISSSMNNAQLYHHNAVPKILHSNGSNFVSVSSEGLWKREAPMLLEAWTQTSGDDFDLMRNLDASMDAENQALRDKVRYLEAKLQAHTDLLSQIHATSACVQQAQQDGHTDISPPTPPTHQSQILTPPNSVICAAVPATAQQQPRAEVIDYKIIAAAGADADSIEIRLAAESLNSLSTSADSDRLEICLGDEQQQPGMATIKREQNGTPMQFIKRRKLELQEITAASNIVTPLKQQQNAAYKLPMRKSTGQMMAKPSPKHMVDMGDNVMVSIGPNNTCVPASIFENINWVSSSLATRKLLVAIFDRETLATHSMTGKPSPAFKDQHKPLKQMLDPLKIQDIIFAVTRKCSASEKEVRNAITTKCADENKMMKIQKGKRRSNGLDLDKENVINT